MQVVRLSVDEARAWFEAHPHPNVLGPMAHPERKVYVGLRDGDRLVATATVQRRRLRCAQVGGIYVLEDVRKRGVGRALMAGVFDAARSLDCRWIALGAYRREPDVSPFYRAVGFRALVPYIPGTASPWPGGALARALARLFRVEAGPDAIRIMVRKA